MRLIWFISISLFFVTIVPVSAFPISLVTSEFFIREGFQKEWTQIDPRKCTDCKTILFSDESFKSIRLKKVFPEKFENASQSISWEDRTADTFSIGTVFQIDKPPKKNENYGIFLERIGINWEIYLNGHLLKSEMHLDSSGKISKPKATRFPLVPIPSEYFQEGENFLYIVLSGDIRDTYFAVFFNSPEIDHIENLSIRQFDLFRFFMHTSYLVLAFLYLILFVLYPEQKFNFYFSLSLLLYGLYRFSDSHLSFILFENSQMQQNVSSILYLMLSGVMMLYFNHLIDNRTHWISKVTLFFCLVLCVVKLYLPHAYTFPFLKDVSGNATIFAFGYLIFYRIGYMGSQYFWEAFKNNRASKLPHPLFQAFVYSWNTKIEFVLLLFLCPSYSTLILDYSDFSTYDIHNYSSDFTFLLFYGLMAFFTYRRKFLLVEQHKRELERLHWEKETERLRNEIALNEEREKLFADIHDNLGGKLLDLSFQLDRVQLDKPLPGEEKKKFKDQIGDVLKSLRNRLLAFEDMHAIEVNFQEGIQNFLLRRYSLADRKIHLIWDDGLLEVKLNKKTSLQLLGIFQELVNNDLKYGKGRSSWKFRVSENYLQLQFESETDWDNSQISNGNGHKTLLLRTKELRGEFIQDIQNNRYTVELQVPVF